MHTSYTPPFRPAVFDVDNDKARAAWEMEGSTDWQADGVDATNGFSFEVRPGPAGHAAAHCCAAGAIAVGLR